MGDRAYVDRDAARQMPQSMPPPRGCSCRASLFKGGRPARAIAPAPNDGPETSACLARPAPPFLGRSMRPVGHAGFVSLLAVYLFYRLSGPAKVASSPAASLSR